jgi:hypothetical protein
VSARLIVVVGRKKTVSTLTFHFSRPRDLLEKLSRDLVRLDVAASTYDKQQIADSLFDFCSTGYAIKDWLKENCTSAFQPDDVESYVRSTSTLAACRDICNASKHFTITRYIPSTGDVYASASAATVTAVQVPTAGVGLESDPTQKFRVKVLLKDGTKYEVTELARLVLQAWERFFTLKGV